MAEQRRRPGAVVVTTAPRSRIDELDAKRRHYAIAMVSRIALIGLSVAFLRPWPWALYPAMLLAMVLPYFAVVLANTFDRDPGEVEAFDRGDERTAIGPGRPVDPH